MAYFDVPPRQKVIANLHASFQHALGDSVRLICRDVRQGRQGLPRQTWLLRFSLAREGQRPRCPRFAFTPGGAASPLPVVVCCVHKSTQILTDWRHLQNPANSEGAASPLPAIRCHTGNEDVAPPVWLNPARSSESQFQETIVPPRHLQSAKPTND